MDVQPVNLVPYYTFPTHLNELDAAAISKNLTHLFDYHFATYKKIINNAATNISEAFNKLVNVLDKYDESVEEIAEAGRINNEFYMYVCKVICDLCLH